MKKLDYEELKKQREYLGFTQSELAEKTGVKLNTIKNLEIGRSIPEGNIIEKICIAVDVDIKEIYNPNFKDTKVICDLNNKGGSGKTSTTGSLGYALADLGYRVLLIDADMQQNLTHSFNLDDNKKNIYNAMKNEESLLDHIISTEYNNIDFVVADINLSSIEMELFNKILRESVLKRCIQPVIDKGIYDYILIDTNPTLAMLNFNVVNASHKVLIPIQLSSFGIEGIGVLMDFISSVQSINDEVEILGIVINNFDVRKKKIINETLPLLEQACGNLIFDTRIRVDTTIEHAQMYNKPVQSFDKDSRIAKEYKALAKEVIRRC